MKKLIFTIVLPLFFFLYSSQSEAQAVRRHRARVVAGKPTVPMAGQLIRTRRRVNRRVHRRIARRTLNTLPVGTRALPYRGLTYYPLNGFYFIRQNSVYVSVLPPIGFTVVEIPWEYTTVTVSENNYLYANGLYYSKAKDKFEITEPPVGALIKELPEGYEEVVIGTRTLYAYDDSLYESKGDGYELVGFLDGEN